MPLTDDVILRAAAYAPDAVVIVDAGGIVRCGNDGAARISPAPRRPPAGRHLRSGSAAPGA